MISRFKENKSPAKLRWSDKTILCSNIQVRVGNGCKHKIYVTDESLRFR